MTEQQLETIFLRHGVRPERLIPILQEIQAECGYLPDETVRRVADRLGMLPAKVYAVASFYETFVFKRSGKYILRICDGTSCHSRGSRELAEAMYEKLGITAEDNTTADGLITLETVSCLGACSLSPNLEINGRVFSRQTLESITDKVEIIQMTQEDLDE